MARPARVSPDRILAAAAVEFAARGYAGARVDRIARRARVNKAMLYYHFHSKQGLYRALLRDTFGRAAERLQAIAASAAPPADQLDRVIAAIAGFVREHAVLLGDHAPRDRRERRPSRRRNPRRARSAAPDRRRRRSSAASTRVRSGRCIRWLPISACLPRWSSTSPARRSGGGSPRATSSTVVRSTTTSSFSMFRTPCVARSRAAMVARGRNDESRSSHPLAGLCMASGRGRRLVPRRGARRPRPRVGAGRSHRSADRRPGWRPPAGARTCRRRSRERRGGRRASRGDRRGAGAGPRARGARSRRRATAAPQGWGAGRGHPPGRGAAGHGAVRRARGRRRGRCRRGRCRALRRAARLESRDARSSATTRWPGATWRRARAVGGEDRVRAARENLARLRAGARPEEIDAARARVAAADAQIATQQKAVADAMVTAPVSGTVTERLVEVGEIIQPRAPILIVTEPRSGVGERLRRRAGRSRA